MTAAEYRKILESLGLKGWSGHVTIARRIPNGQGRPINPRTSYRWAKGESPIPMFTAKYIKQLAKGV